MNDSLIPSGELSGAARLFAGLRAGDVRALGRAVSLVEDRAAGAQDLLMLCRDALKDQPRAVRIGITGPAGAGKSTLVDALTREFRGRERRVGIVAVDPSSAFSGGAILGDRIRIGESAGDAGVYMRSMATRGHLGGLAEAAEDVLVVIEASGRDVLLIETTGVGQGEIEVVRLADVVAVVLVPGMGDSIQSLKAGVLEIASVFVLNKADVEGVDRLEGEIGEMLALTHVVAGEAQIPKVLRTVATIGQGIWELVRVLDSLAAEERVRPASLLGAVKRVIPGAVLDHLGIAVRSLADSQRLYAALGVPVSSIEEVAHERVRVVMLAVGESRIELLEPMQADSVIGRFLDKRGEGIHHVALRIPNLPAAVETLKAEGVRLVSEAIQVGAGGHRYVFVHPANANGVLLELVEAAH